MSSTLIEEMITLTIMGSALGLDAFSVGLGMGVIQLKFRQILNIGFVIGLFHVIMPLLGMIIGYELSDKFGRISVLLGGVLLLGIGFHMIYSTLFGKEENKFSPNGIGLLLFAFSVSVDSFSVGISLGTFGAKTWLTILLFGIISTILTWAGLLLGRRVEQELGKFGELLGGSVLLLFGLKLLFFST
jgi:manganese efflux pump family protein